MNDPHLLLISLGPVQDFIAQARRSRDLWTGSHLLSELSRAAAKSLAEGGADLIFPALCKGDPELTPCDRPTRSSGFPPVSVANKILARISELDPAALAKAARQAVIDRWTGIAEGVYTKCASILAPQIAKVWDEQIADVVEYYAAWAPINGSYRDARRQVEQALAGRKTLRDFSVWTEDRAGAPKSSLDGARVSVLTDDRMRDGVRKLFVGLRIGQGEQLDAVGLAKRAGFEPDQFVPIVNVAAGPWLAKAGGLAAADLRILGQACADLGLGKVNRDLPVVTAFPHDASVFYPNRWPSLFNEMGKGDRSKAQDWGKRNVEPLLAALKPIGCPSSYVACLVADGDRMGQALDNLDDVKQHKIFSQALADFPAKAREIVESRDHLGSLIYAGGDDVLAFLPVATAPLCAKELAETFRRIMTDAVKACGADIDAPTLSVGIGIGHVLDGMGDLLDLGRKAEKKAKTAGRNALAVVIDKRSGGQPDWSCSWDADPDPVARLQDDIALFGEDRLPTGKVYELRVLLRSFPANFAAGPAVLGAYAAAILAHARGGGGKDQGSRADLGIAPAADHAEAHRSLSAAIARLLLATELQPNGFQGASAPQGGAL